MHFWKDWKKENESRCLTQLLRGRPCSWQNGSPYNSFSCSLFRVRIAFTSLSFLILTSWLVMPHSVCTSWCKAYKEGNRLFSPALCRRKLLVFSQSKWQCKQGAFSHPLTCISVLLSPEACSFPLLYFTDSVPFLPGQAHRPWVVSFLVNSGEAGPSLIVLT
jgi:hypothetical protein